MTEPNYYTTELTASAQRSLAKLPPRVLEPLVAFIFGSLAADPETRGKPLRDEFNGYWSARRGDHGVIYRIDDQKLVISVVRVGTRSDIYRPR